MGGGRLSPSTFPEGCVPSQDRDRDLDGGERGVDPHPAVGQQWPALRLHPVGDQLPRPPRHRCLHPGRLLEEDQRAGDMPGLSGHPGTINLKSKSVSQHLGTEIVLKKQRSASAFSPEPPGISRPELFSRTLTLSVWFY